MTKPIEYETEKRAINETENYSGYGVVGVVYAPHGIVEIHQEEGTKQAVVFIHGGILYERAYQKQLSWRGIITKAARFVKEIVNGVKQNG